ncbi:hypothetical protein EYE40_07960 [Glaciihabitans arcticus]|uniref:Glycosyltransferase RgtA/B/C/D-like domain-containing protein n=1 Tax=Glaciihabitans arcticus TaxID=2668039 RepID=A0A4Q9GY70_9MICO|nr:hypothetical protein EYE40_07960 [Glaciihabitans arcticus]
MTPWWLRVLVIFIASRAVTTGILLFFAERQPLNAWTGPSPDYFDFARLWDGHWYFIVAMSAYPTELPMDAAGHVTENAWAFMPAYPIVVRFVMLLTGLPFDVAAVAISVGFAAGTALLFYKLMALVLSDSTALFATVLFCFAPLSPILQVAYAESMHAFFLTLALYLLLQRRYGMMFPVVAVMALTRPSGLAFALALLLHVIHRFMTRGRDPFPLREIVASLSIGMFSALMGVTWLLIAWGVTGSFTAYTDTELAWRSSYVGWGELVPFSPWIQAAGFWGPRAGFELVVPLAVGFLVGFTVLLFSPWGRRLGPDLRFWSGSYLLYLLAVFFPQSSTFRLLVPIFPLWGALAQPRSAIYRWALVVLSIAGQVGWVYIAWFVDGYDWTPP